MDIAGLICIILASLVFGAGLMYFFVWLAIMKIGPWY